jgi:hypothetical protein
MTTKEYIQLATKVIDYYKFTYIPRGWAIVQCAKRLKEVHAKYPDKTDMLPIVAKHFFITQNNIAYKYAHKTPVWQTQN